MGSGSQRYTTSAGALDTGSSSMMSRKTSMGTRPLERKTSVTYEVPEVEHFNE
eukprot:CAMPEP_0184666348 /NCGR_PEP_ID=MMETSP0308-20130426/61057_1 /TAXON_ID=38269 /ORGANISM="Gloeochaete witrockiana, Strain SAG 46.84" /LENGTH=52 /DNA_ID=CAMNT_0027110867 /DNA_START=8 /DNA_END=163 /DNA_ORIENTATION=-